MITRIDGSYMDRSLKDFAEECEDRIEVEEARPNPDTSLIALLSDGVRLTREMTVQAARYAQCEATVEATVAAWRDKLTQGRK